MAARLKPFGRVRIRVSEACPEIHCGRGLCLGMKIHQDSELTKFVIFLFYLSSAKAGRILEE
jgi:hypothetical protein